MLWFLQLKDIVTVFTTCVVEQCLYFLINLAFNFILLFCENRFINTIFMAPYVNSIIETVHNDYFILFFYLIYIYIYNIYIQIYIYIYTNIYKYIYIYIYKINFQTSENKSHNPRYIRLSVPGISTSRNIFEKVTKNLKILCLQMSALTMRR